MALLNKAVMTSLLNAQHTFFPLSLSSDHSRMLFFHDCFKTRDMFIMKPLICNKSLSRNVNKKLTICQFVMSFLNRTGCHSGGVVHPQFLKGQGFIQTCQQFKSRGSPDDEVMCWFRCCKHGRPWRRSLSLTPAVVSACVTSWPCPTLKHHRLLGKDKRSGLIFYATTASAMDS